jgi:hypothetical protein
MSERIVTLSELIARYYGRPLIVRGHCDWGGIHGAPVGNTTCPGKLERTVLLAQEKMRELVPPGGAVAGGVVTGGATGVGLTRGSATPAPIGTVALIHDAK